MALEKETSNEGENGNLKTNSKLREDVVITSLLFYIKEEMGK